MRGTTLEFLIERFRNIAVLENGRARVCAGRQCVDLLNPDFGLFAKAFGVRYWRADTDPAFESALREAIPSNEPSLIEVQLRP